MWFPVDGQYSGLSSQRNERKERKGCKIDVRDVRIASSSQ